MRSVRTMRCGEEGRHQVQVEGDSIFAADEANRKSGAYRRVPAK